MGNLLVQTRSLSDIVQSAMYHSCHDEAYHVIDRLLPSTIRENISISLILFKIEPFALLVQSCEEKQILKLVGGLLAILMEQTPDVVYVDCVDVNEFIVLIPAIKPEQALTAGEEICHRFIAMAKTVVRKKGLSLKLKGGLAVFPDDAKNRLDLFRAARAAVYQANRNRKMNVLRAQQEKRITKSTQYAFDQFEQLNEISSREGVNEDSFLRDALDCYLKRFILPSNLKRR